MILFVDASALISMIVGEADADALADRMEAIERIFVSPMVVWETVAGLSRSHQMAIDHARELVRSFLTDHRIEICTIDEGTGQIALDAYARFGEGRHPAALNMGDCFAYACAKSLGAGLLYKGDDFARTDVARGVKGGRLDRNPPVLVRAASFRT